MRHARATSIAAVLASLVLMGGSGTVLRPPSAVAATQDCPQGTLALTFDAGPDVRYTPGIVRILERNDVPATFFMLGDKVRAHPALARKVVAAGFTVGNHTYDHADLTQLSTSAGRRDILRAFRAFRRAGLRPPQRTDLVRLPFGRHDPQVDRMLRRNHWPKVGWAIGTHDGNPEATAASIVRAAEAGIQDYAKHPGVVHKVVLMHDGAQRKPFTNHTAKALPAIISYAENMGFCFTGVTADGHAQPRPVTLQQARQVERAEEAGDRPTPGEGR